MKKLKENIYVLIQSIISEFKKKDKTSFCCSQCFHINTDVCNGCPLPYGG